MADSKLVAEIVLALEPEPTEVSSETFRNALCVRLCTLAGMPAFWGETGMTELGRLGMLRSSRAPMTRNQRVLLRLCRDFENTADTLSPNQFCSIRDLLGLNGRDLALATAFLEVAGRSLRKSELDSERRRLKSGQSRTSTRRVDSCAEESAEENTGGSSAPPRTRFSVKVVMSVVLVLRRASVRVDHEVSRDCCRLHRLIDALDWRVASRRLRLRSDKSNTGESHAQMLLAVEHVEEIAKELKALGERARHKAGLNCCRAHDLFALFDSRARSSRRILKWREEDRDREKDQAR